MLEKGSANSTISERRWKTHRVLATVVFVLGGLLLAAKRLLAQTSNAANNVQLTAQAAGISGGTTDLPTLIGRIINIALGFVGIVLLGLLLYAGFLWMTSGGDPKKIETAKAYIRNAVIGIIIIASAFAIVNFILSQLEGAIMGGGGVGGFGTGAGGFPSASGSLGGGIIEYHVPAPNATGVPRNTAIVITYKAPILVPSMIQDWTVATSNTATGLNDSVVKIFPTDTTRPPLTSAQARVSVTADHKTFVIRPVDLLGSPTANMGYTVQLMPGPTGLRLEDGSPAFTGAFSSGYQWQFEVSTLVDNTPPQVVSVVPISSGLYAPNIVVQVNFSEPVDPTSASGIWDGSAGFTNIALSSVPSSTPSAPPIRPSGTFKISNGYTTVEFTSDVVCGRNTCGNNIYCLPPQSVISTVVRAATLSTAPPAAQLTASGYDGIVDLAGNSLDGNADGHAQGPDADNYSWGFGTTDHPNLTPPHVQSTEPPVHSSHVPVDQQPAAIFDSVMQASTIVSDNISIRSNEPTQMSDTFWWFSHQTVVTTTGADLGRIAIQHRNYLPSTSSTAYMYAPYYDSALQNVYQNCFNPAAYNDAHGTTCVGPNCCDNVAQGGSC